jgi:L-alanine-DL-glutamate epimerase-like enolase superfamily enzyme
MLASIEATLIVIPFTAAFKHAAASRAQTQTIWVEARSSVGLSGFGEGCPREYVTAESTASALAFVLQHRASWRESIRDLPSLLWWSEQHRCEIDANPAAWTAVELALLDLLGKVEGKPVEKLLGLPGLEGRFQYTAVLGDASAPRFEEQLQHYIGAGFRDFKIKLSGDPWRDLAKTRALASAGILPSAARADANNLWPDADSAQRALQTLGFTFFALEEPLRPGDYDGMARIGRECNARIILDESFLRIEQLDDLARHADRWVLNVRVSKVGGLLRALDVTRAARRCGLKIIVGAHVGETSLLTRAGLVVAHGARDILIGQEGAFGTHLLAVDAVEPTIMFGAGGAVDASKLGLANKPGFGVSPSGAIAQFQAR